MLFRLDDRCALSFVCLIFGCEEVDEQFVHVLSLVVMDPVGRVF